MASRVPHKNPGEPPMRNFEGRVVEVMVRQPAKLHTLAAAAAMEGMDGGSPLPAANLPLLHVLSELELSELIERYVEFVNKEGRSVRLQMHFVRRYLQRFDHNEGGLARVFGVLTLPLMLPDRTLLTGVGLDREYEVVFRVPEELRKRLPEPGSIKSQDIKEAMRFLTDEWLVDVATDYEGKCVAIALAMTIIERMLLPERPAFFVTSGQRGGGKTTLLNMISMAVLGVRAPASAWSPSDEERRKALFAYFCDGVPFIVWDNIPRGAAIACPSIEKALTAHEYADRILGESRTRVVSAEAVMGFTGNNIAPRGDLASRTLTVRVQVDRPDPENRKFEHPDPLAWTLHNRGQILQALFVIMMGWKRKESSAETRFKLWWDLIGSSIEHAAELCGEDVRFKRMFLTADEKNEETIGLAEVLDILEWKFPRGFTAADVAYALNKIDDEEVGVAEADKWRSQLKAGLEQASGKPFNPMVPITAQMLTPRLKAMLDAPTKVGEVVLALRFVPGNRANVFEVKVMMRD